MKTTFEHILVAVNFSEPSDRAIDFAADLALKLGAAVHLVHVVEEPFFTEGSYQFHLPDTPARRESRYDRARARLSTIAGRLNERNIPATIETRGGSATEGIVNAAIDCGADLIVIGTHDRSRLQHILNGSVAEQVIRLTPCPVLTVRASRHAAVVAAMVDRVA